MNLIPKQPTSYPIPPLRELTMIIFGAPGSGKTTFCSKDSNTLFIGTEPGQDFTTAAVVPCYNWSTFLGIIKEIKLKRSQIINKQIPVSECPYNNFVIDIVDNLANQCRDFICQKKRISYPPSNDFGKTWSEITQEWKRQITELLMLGNVKFISHCTVQQVELELSNGITEEKDRFVPTFSGSKSAQYLDGIVNAMGFAHVNKQGDHTITFKQTATIGAKDRTNILSKCGTLPLDFSLVNKAYEEKAKELKLTIISKRQRS